MESSFDNLNKLLAKAAALIAKEGIPTFYFKLLISLEETVDSNLEDKVARNRPPSSRSTSLAPLRPLLSHSPLPAAPLLAVLARGKIPPLGLCRAMPPQPPPTLPAT